MKNWIKLLGFVLVVALLVYLARAYNLEEAIGGLQSWVEAQGAVAPFVYIGVYILATVLAVPASALTIMAPLIFGVFMGVVYVAIGANIGAALCFLISKYFARNTIKGILDKNEKFKKLEDLTEKNGYIIVAITRLVPIFPFNLLNYGFGLTNIPFKIYFLWTVVCTLPGIILYVSGVGAVTAALENGEIPWTLVGVVLLILAIITFVVKQAKSRLKE